MDAKRKRFIKLGWQIIEAKYRYYGKDDAVLKDHEYDALEREYDALAKELGEEPTAANMVGYNGLRPSAQLAADKVEQRFPPPKCNCPTCAKD